MKNLKKELKALERAQKKWKHPERQRRINELETILEAKKKRQLAICN